MHAVLNFDEVKYIFFFPFVTHTFGIMSKNLISKFMVMKIYVFF